MYSLTLAGKDALREIQKTYKTVWTEECKLAFD